MTPSQKNEKALSALQEAKRVLGEIHDELYGHNLQLDSWFDQGNWEVDLDEAIAALSQPATGRVSDRESIAFNGVLSCISQLVCEVPNKSLGIDAKQSLVEKIFALFVALTPTPVSVGVVTDEYIHAEIVAKLKRYTAHSDRCLVATGMSSTCTCGLAEVLKEIKQDG